MSTETQSLSDAFTVTVGDKVTDTPGFTAEHITRAVTIRHNPTGREHAATFTYNPTMGRYSDKDPKRHALRHGEYRPTKPIPEEDVRFILRAVADDAACAEDAPTFDDFCSELGFGPFDNRAEYRRAEDAHNGCLEALAYFRSCGVDVYALLEDLSAKGIE